MSLRYGHGKSVHAGLDLRLCAHFRDYRDWLEEMIKFEPDYRAILEGRTPINPDFYNGASPSYDCAAIHMMVATQAPKRWLEVGSGHSTAFAMNSAMMHQTGTVFEVVDPEAQPWLANFPITVHPVGAGDVPVETFTALESGDILFIDGSHMATSGSDVVVMFLEVLPRLKSGVWVQIHDIFLPSDYPPAWGGYREDKYTEQYMLALLLLMDQQHRYQVELPMYYCLTTEFCASQAERMNALWTSNRRRELPPQTPLDLMGASFWMRVR